MLPLILNNLFSFLDNLLLLVGNKISNIKTLITSKFIDEYLIMTTFNNIIVLQRYCDLQTYNK
jgi:hypothetical protein